MRSKLQGIAWAFIIFSLSASSASATPITFFFEARVTQLGQVNSFGDVSIGDTFSGSYTFESTVVGTGPPGGLTYAFSGPTVGLTALVGTAPVVLTDYEIQVSNNTGGPPKDVYVVSGTSGPNPTDVFFRIVLIDSTASVFSDASLPLLPPPLTGFDGSNSEVRTQQPSTLNPFAMFEITSLTAVPEPPMFLLLLGGLIGLAIQGDRRRGLRGA